MFPNNQHKWQNRGSGLVSFHTHSNSNYGVIVGAYYQYIEPHKSWLPITVQFRQASLYCDALWWFANYKVLSSACYDILRISTTTHALKHESRRMCVILRVVCVLFYMYSHALTDYMAQLRRYHYYIANAIFSDIFNSSPPSVAYMLLWIGSAFVQIMACRLVGTKPLSKQCWAIVNWTLINTLQLNFNQITKLFIHDNAFQNIVCEMAAILFNGRLGKKNCSYALLWSIFTTHMA